MNLDHEIRVDKLRELLAELPDDTLLMPNAVRNLVFRNPTGPWLGYIDLLGDTIERFDP